MADRYSAIVVGAGHNGLVAANYLAMEGLKVLVLERRDFVGGASVTEELFPGVWFPTCAFLAHLLQRQVIDDLELRKHGLEIYPVDPTQFYPFPNGQYILTWYDDDRTAEEINKISPKDGNRYHDWIAFWTLAAGIMHRYYLTEPPTIAEVAASVRGTPDEPIFERMLTGNMKDLVEEYFEHELIQAAFIEGQDAGDVAAPGSIMSLAYKKCNMFTDQQNFGIPKGGMGAITQSMASSAESRGVEIRTGVEVKQIDVRNGRAAGVCLDTGEIIEADVVLSNADPKRTFLTLLDEDTMAPKFVDHVKRLKTDVGGLKFFCSLRQLPDFSAYLGNDFDPRYLAHIRICPSVEYHQRSWDDAKNGRSSSCPVMHMQIPTVLDSSLCPEGQHVMSTYVFYAPVRLRDGSWVEAKRGIAEQLIESIAEYAPNFRECIIDWELFTPEDFETRVYLTDGNIRHLNITTQQMLAQRPSRQLSNYRTPIDGLYLCGAGTHPGGEVTGAPGHNAAKAVLRDFELVK